VRNSWSPAWGEKGYIRLLRADSQKEEVCGSDVTPQVITLLLLQLLLLLLLLLLYLYGWGSKCATFR
jgi:hypothetical protein